MPLFVHGIVRTGEVTGRGLGERAGADVEMVSHENVSEVVTSTEEEEILPSRANLIRHTRVLETTLEATTVLPMRFGVAVPDGATLARDYLEPEQKDLRRELERLADHVELRVKGRYQEEAALRTVLASDRRARRLRGRQGLKARMELGERVVEGIAALREHHHTYAVEELRSSAAGMAPGAVSDPLDAFRFSLLVERNALDDLEQRRERLAAALAPLVELEVLGPMPPFSFTGSEGDPWDS